jgi:hypothetical protein
MNFNIARLDILYISKQEHELPVCRYLKLFIKNSRKSYGIYCTSFIQELLGSLTCEEGGNLSTWDLVLFTSHPKDGLVVNLYIPHNRRMPLQAEEALGPIF